MYENETLMFVTKPVENDRLSIGDNIHAHLQAWA